MGWKRLLEPDISKFIREHADSDVASLGLKKPPIADWPYPLILDQIKVRQKAKVKSPVFHAIEDFIFPSANVFEQSSSCACASYKASLFRGKTFVDLTAGSGADSFALAQQFLHGILIDTDKNNAELICHNTLAVKEQGGIQADIAVQHTDAESYVREMPDGIDLVYIDPQRRSDVQRGIFDLSKCSPDLPALLPILLQKTENILLKTSPVLDIHLAVSILKHVFAVHVVQWQGECKEVLYCLRACQLPDKKDIPVTVVDVDDRGLPVQSFTFTARQEAESDVQYGLPETYIYEPAPAIFKAGCFSLLSASFGLKKLHKHTHLYTSNQSISNFPGKCYQHIESVAPRAASLPTQKAELVLRNYPGHVNELRKKLKLAEGEEYRIFACTLVNEEKKLLVCKKLDKFS